MNRVVNDGGSGTYGEPKRQISPKMIIGGIIGVLVLIFILQNTARRQINFWFWDVRAPLFIWMIVLLAAGFVLGSIFPWFRRKRSDDD